MSCIAVRPIRSTSLALLLAPALTLIVVIAVIPLGSRATAVECWLPPVDARIADPFRPPTCPWCPGNRGIEYATSPGTPVRAVRGGVVSFAGVVAGTAYVVIEHPDGRRATYGALESIAVDRGEVVVARVVLGSAGDRMHFGLRDGARYVDPAPHLGRVVFPTRLVPSDGSPPPPASSTLVCGPHPRVAGPAPTSRLVAGRIPPTVR